MSLTLPESLDLLLPDGTIRRILLEDYLRGVVAAALPADAPLEAMKALAVAARTFAANTRRHLERGADVCTLRHCQAWNERANARAARAVMETRGIVATFNEKLIEAFYFEHCDGKTREAKGVLMDAPAYLKSVACPCGFASMKGHGIGMCQRGMLAMARVGDDYRTILTHYYSGVAVEQLAIDENTRARDPIKPVKRTTDEVGQTLPAQEVKSDQHPHEKRETRHEKRETRGEVGQSPPAGQARSDKLRPHVERETFAVKGQSPSVAAPTAFQAPTTGGVERAQEKPVGPAQPPVETLPTKTERKTVGPRRAYREKIEQAKAAAAPPPEPAVIPPPKPPEPLITLDNETAAEADDLMLFLAVEDVPPAKDERRKTKDEGRTSDEGGRTTEDARARTEGQQPTEKIDETFDPSLAYIPPLAVPPPTMPEEMPGAVEFELGARPPFSMPEDLPSAGDLDFLAPPAGAMPEDPSLSEFLATPIHSSIEPDLGEFLPPVEKFYTPLDAPPTMPEEMPSFNAVRREETPISWAAPPPLKENAYAVKPPQVLVDSLPGPRVIAGNLSKVGMLVTIRDARGNSIVTVSGVAKQYGSAGFEAPVTDDGAYQVKFDGTELDVQLENETVFIYYS